MLMSGKQLSLDSRMDLVQRLVTDRNGSQAGESVEILESPSEYDETTEGSFTIKRSAIGRLIRC